MQKKKNNNKQKKNSRDALFVKKFKLVKISACIVRFIGEESSIGPCVLTDDPTWIIDPIDGTTNYVHGSAN